ncbi:MAG: WecB/TagA/CpsF family glycosyltransferase [Gammaproteobacteria bacterium]|nr:WecB/TagA/CpsF family glycosyltransferase [Gammaproteobacteria bacterium]
MTSPTAAPNTPEKSNGVIQRRDLLGFFAHPGTLQDYLALIKQAIESNTPHTVLYHNLHSLYTYFTSAKLRTYYAGNTVLVDGMPLVWLYQFAGEKISRDHRVTYVDFIMPMMQQARDNNWPVFHLGQSTDIQQAALNKIRAEVPGIQIEGHDGYFDQTSDSADSLEVIRQVNAFDTKLLLVGFGAPRQEAWLHAHRESIDAPAVFTCGACMEYVAGAVKTPPRWMGRLGLEWSFRLLENPKRFAFRYLVEPLILLAFLFKNFILAKLGRKAS